MNCSICKRPLLEGASACVVCGAPVAARPSEDPHGRMSAPPGGPPPVARASMTPSGPPPQAPQPQAMLTPPAYSYTPPPFPANVHAAPPYPQAPQAYPPPQAPQLQPSQHPYYGYGAPPVPMAAPMAAQMQAPMHAQMQMPHGMQHGMANHAPNNIAVASFICGMLGLVPFWIGFALCILAIIFGVLGIQRAGQLPGERGKGLAIAGLVLGIIFVLPAGCGL